MQQKNTQQTGLKRERTVVHLTVKTDSKQKQSYRFTDCQMVKKKVKQIEGVVLCLSLVTTFTNV